MSKKAQGIPINVIIIAAIAIIVLVVLVAIFSGYIGDWVKRLRGVETGQTCTSYKTTINGAEYSAAWQNTPCGEGYREIITVTDAAEHPGQYCCIVAG